MGPRLVVVTTFPVSPPSHGGQRRIRDVLANLAESGADITVVALHTYSKGVLLDRVGPRFRQISVGGSEAHQQAAVEVSRQVNVYCEDILADEAPRLSPHFLEVLRDACRGADAVIAAHPYCISSIEAVWDGPVFYHADDDEAGLKAKIFPQSAAGRMLADATRAIEARCMQRASIVYAISEGVADSLAARYGAPRNAILVVPPSIEPSTFVSTDVAARRARRRAVFPAPLVLFVGSGHPPNVQAAKGVVVPAARALPDVQFVVVGSVGKLLDPAVAPPNLAVTGLVSDADLSRLLEMADVALNPVDLGGGVNIKMFDYVAGAAPILTSDVGLSGFAYLRPYVDVVDGDWAAAIRRTLDMPYDQLEARTSAAQRAVAERHAPAVVVEPLLERIRDAIGAASGLRTRGGERRKIVVATHHTIHPVNSGGARRMQQLFGQLGTRYDVVVCSRFEIPQRPDEVRLAPGLVERRTPRSAVQQEIITQAIARYGGPGGRDEVRFDETGWLNPAYADTLERSLRGASVAFCTHPYTFGILRRLWDGPIVYDAMDVEYLAQVAVLKDAPNRSAMLHRVATIERRCAREADLISTISETDAELFAAIYDVDPAKIVVVPPALDTEVRAYLDHEARAIRRETSSFAGRRVALFIGSNWPMNVRAVVRLGAIARALPDVVFLVVGSVAGAAPAALMGNVPSNLQFTGAIDDAAFRAVLEIANLAVNPIEEGSGTCMKVLDYVAAGLPLITTPIGGRGYGFHDGVDADVVSLDEFPPRIQAALASPRGAQERAARAYDRLRRERSWEALAEPLFRGIERLVASPVLV
jgi:glycosyltransferase involved in cell wall biosynthesis